LTAPPALPSALLDRVRALPGELEQFREMLLANLIMFGELPGPTFGEGERIRFLQQRFTECELDNCSVDELGNGVGVRRGREGRRNILVTAHADTPFPETVAHTLALDADRVTGPAVADNSLGLAVLATLPTVLDRLDIPLASNLVLLGASRSLGRGNLGGLRFFLGHQPMVLDAAVALEGVQLGRLNYSSLAQLGGEIRCEVAEERLAVGDHPGAIAVLSRVIDRLQALPLPREPATSLVLGSISGGSTYKSPARRATLRFSLRSESDEQVATLAELLDGIVDEESERAEAVLEFEVIARTNAWALADDHPLVGAGRSVAGALGIPVRAGCCSSAVASFLEHQVPGLTIGITTGRNLGQEDEEVDIAPMRRGLAQLIGLLMAIDGGACD